MQLNLFTDYGLRTLLRLAMEPDRVFTTSEIAQEYALSRNHLLKVVQSLSAAGYVEATRGVGGGIQLAKPADEIRIGEVIEQLEGRGSIVQCVGKGGPCNLLPNCILKFHLNQAEEAFYQYLKGLTLAQCLGANVVAAPKPAAKKPALKVAVNLN
jgi:Rrf2 family nitric oxide-sensitive transcriptional repressor